MSFAGADEFTTHDEHRLFSRIEAQIKRRFNIGSQVSVHNIVQELSKQVRTIQVLCIVLHFSFGMLELGLWKTKLRCYPLLLKKYPESAVFKVISALVRRGELQHRMQRKMLYRIK